MTEKIECFGKNIARNSNANALPGEVSDRNKEHVLDNGGKIILMKNWQHLAKFFNY